MFKAPTSWLDTKGISEYLGVSTRQFKNLKRSWIDAGEMVEGKHYRVFGTRTHRYDMEQMHRLAHRMGRIIPLSTGGRT